MSHNGDWRNDHSGLRTLATLQKTQVSSQHARVSSQLSIIPVPEDLMPLLASMGHGTYTVCRHTCILAKHPHT